MHFRVLLQAFTITLAVSRELQGEKKNQAVLIFPVYFMKAVAGLFEGLTNRSFKLPTHVSKRPSQLPAKHERVQPLMAAGIKEHSCITCCFGL